MPIALLCGLALYRSGGATELGFVLIGATAVGIAGLFIFLGRAFGRPFAEILEERVRDRTRQTFD